ncbi:hypothetical protein F511_31457 [Dorcoceras hygrometricum]|uniref:Uncharacterized protein n=1 Tax=Dorcoceras hygrometricum TaxID=472368 RepID=A0A2Z7BNV4_9LAMI|nr:hypothetical protein F511_31457 [Dorcoceras hygrometricum]
MSMPKAVYRSSIPTSNQLKPQSDLTRAWQLQPAQIFFLTGSPQAQPKLLKREESLTQKLKSELENYRLNFAKLRDPATTSLLFHKSIYNSKLVPIERAKQDEPSAINLAPSNCGNRRQSNGEGQCYSEIQLPTDSDIIDNSDLNAIQIPALTHIWLSCLRSDFATLNTHTTIKRRRATNQNGVSPGFPFTNAKRRRIASNLKQILLTLIQI